MSDLNAFNLIPAKHREYHIYDMASHMAKGVRSHNIQVQTPDTFDAGVQRIINGLRALMAARRMDDLCSVMPLFKKDMVLSTPFVLMTRKGHMRVSSYLTHFFVDTELEPLLAKVHGPMAGNKFLVDLEATLWVKPHRTWLLLPTLLLPKAVPLTVHYKIGVDGGLESGRIELIEARLANLPALPWPLRAYFGVLAGALPHASEPLWGIAMDMLFGDEFYTRKRIVDHLRDSTAAARGMAMVRDAATTDKALDTANDYGNAVANYAANSVHYAQDVAMRLYESATQTASQATTYVAETAQTTVDTAKQAAQSVYDTAGQAVQTGQQAAQEAYESTKASAESAVDTTRNAAARQTAKAAERVSAPGGEADMPYARRVPVTTATR